MAYIIFVNPDILAATGMDKDAVFVATCLAAAVGTLLMGLLANYPIALAPGMGLNAFFSFAVVGSMGYSWQVALGAVFLSGILFFILSVLPVREWIINSIPKSQKMAIAAGIGFFLAIIGLKNAGIVVDHPATLVTLGNVSSPEAMLAALGFVLMVVLHARFVRGDILIAILAVTGIGWAFGLHEPVGLISLPPDPSPTFLQMDISGALNVGLISVIFAFLFVDLFDTAGTLIGVSQRAGFLDKDGRLPRLRQALLADSTATVVGAAFGTSTTTSYIESAAGISQGGRTGLTAVVVAVLFLLALFFSPLASSIPSYATAPALVFVACLMAKGLVEIDWHDITQVGPALVTALAMPLTYSIADGIGLGFITYAAVQVLMLRFTKENIAVMVIALAFVARYIFL